jgi:hypothetical protein
MLFDDFVSVLGRRFHSNFSILQFEPGPSLWILDFDWSLCMWKECAFSSIRVVLSFWVCRRQLRFLEVTGKLAGDCWQDLAPVNPNSLCLGKPLRCYWHRASSLSSAGERDFCERKGVYVDFWAAVLCWTIDTSSWRQPCSRWSPSNASVPDHSSLAC